MPGWGKVLFHTQPWVCSPRPSFAACRVLSLLHWLGFGLFAPPCYVLF